MQIKLAHPLMAQEIAQFFHEHIAENSDSIANREYLCPDGSRAAVRRNQVLVALEGDVIAGALRFYPKKSTQTISLYQFAVAKNYRSKGLLYTMLQNLGDYPIEVLCPIQGSLNTYYSIKGWQCKGQNKGCNLWEWSMGALCR
ncbi:GNAT family N-acetyltransferase [Brevibacillus laterosporus]|uniref:GNAT family N-acetyltransferase n=1 Tax=Brevibacillus laterosporus TaxID=1465 RepID=A0AAP3G9G2_BRELA|nr:GNAT family N-acetyltransferase [Brevibacillus laterosporus]MCR8981422.1 N-acetyltransferase [Brevibacillus laterosporus]MCZ0808576.1 GNAT family N-acetyltransferase [Brevibacillus laterosporus]MCZ0826933.1 GNAT family N-acetyltransferase [Brevibacillus laterosporus]MCZ0850747.1 GNAT family N-acetyltransferase [Brevibacillus laterosporus]